MNALRPPYLSALKAFLDAGAGAREGVVPDGVVGLVQDGARRGLSPLRSLLAAGMGLPALEVCAWAARGGRTVSFVPDEVDEETLRALPPDVCRRLGMVAVGEGAGGSLLVACAEPPGIAVRDELAAVLGQGRSEAALASDPGLVDVALRRYESLLRRERDIAEVSLAGDEAPLPEADDTVGGRADEVVVRILEEAVARNASDVHFEAKRDRVVVRVRVDGVLRHWASYPPSMGGPIVNRLKTMGNLDLADHLRPDSGRASRVLGGVPYDLRIVSLPTVWGREEAVVRVLYPGTDAYDLDSLGFSAPALAAYKELLEEPMGLVVVAGPAGAGKTTTLYATMQVVATEDRKTISVEDPVEYRDEALTQIQVVPHLGLDFDKALAYIVRSDANVLLIGEIRDPGTAKTAVDSAMTGHLVFATLHASSAATVPRRFLELGVPSYSLSATLKGVVNQQLLRRLCRRCRTESPDPAEDYAKIGARAVPAGAGAFRALAGGCAHCSASGYAGRVAVAEVMRVTDEVAEAVASNVPTSEVARLARLAGMATIREEAVSAVLAGTVSAAEVVRVLGRSRPAHEAEAP